MPVVPDHDSHLTRVVEWPNERWYQIDLGMPLAQNQTFTVDLANHALERLDGEFVIISFVTGKYFSVNVTGSDILSLILDGRAQQDWNSILTDAYGVYEPFGISEFVDQCISEGIIKLANEGQGQSENKLPADTERKNWVAPVLSTFDDLSDLLLVDPIHEASTDGWPNAKDN